MRKFQFANGNGPSRHYKDDSESDLSSVGYANYTVQIPLTPDNQPMEITLSSPSKAQRVEDQYASSSLFTGGYSLATRAQLKDKVIESEIGHHHPQMPGSKSSSSCSVPGCDGKVLTDERGDEILPCDCGHKICGDCYRDVVRTGDGVCPGCKEGYETRDEGGEIVRMSKMEQRLSLMKSASMKRYSSFDNNKWLFESKGVYGYGNAMWPKDEESGDGGSGGFGDAQALKDKQWRPLTRKTPISAAIISPYR